MSEQTPDEAEQSRQRAAHLKRLFQHVTAIEITGLVDLHEKSPTDVARLLPRFTEIQKQGGNPAFALFVDPNTGRIWTLRSGFTPDVRETVNGLPFRFGVMSRAVAREAGASWGDRQLPLAGHVEGQAAALMRVHDVANGVLYINGSTPCTANGRGCLYNLPELLSENAHLVVFNKNGRAFRFTGTPD